MDELIRCGWNVHQCPHQADTHIGETCSDLSPDDKVVVVTGDSDLIVYEGIWTVIMPIGRSRELTRFSKQDLLKSLDLPSERHLLLAAIATKNDYFEGIRCIGINRNVDIIRKMDLGSGQREQSITVGISDYLKQLKSSRGKTIASYQHAITAFAGCHEDGSVDAASSADSYSDVYAILQDLEIHRLRRQGPQKRKDVVQPPNEQGTTADGSSQNQQNQGKESKKRKRRSKRRHKKRNRKHNKKRTKARENRRKYSDAK
jgi:hypothetical protein